MKKRIFALLLSMALLANMSLQGTVAAGLDETNPTTVQELVCGFEEEHTHDTACRGSELVCGMDTTDGHTHGDACKEDKLTCELAETEGHTHEDACKQSTLICEITDETHIHEDGCYTESVICDRDEVEAHTHTQDGCYSVTTICELEEMPANSHGDACYDLICEKTEHTHSDSCWVAVCAECRQQTGHAESCSYGVQTIEEPLTKSEFTAFAGAFKETVVTLYRNLGDTEGIEYKAERIGTFMVVEEMTDDAGGLWYKLDFDNDLIDSFGNVYVPADTVSRTEGEPDVPTDPNACDCDNPPENIANHADGCPRKEYIRTQINLPVDEIAANWDNYDKATRNDILDMLEVWDTNKHSELLDKVDNTPIVPNATVSGAPDGYALEIENVEIDPTEFGIENEEDVIAALDISLEKDGVVWQGDDEQESVAVSVDMTQYGIADGTVVRVHHKHGDTITTIEPLIIINSTLTFATDGFSVFVVERAHETTVVEEIEGNEIVMTVGEEITFYWTEGDTVTIYNSAHFWVVDDPEGCIYPQIHSMGAKTHFGNYWLEQHQAPWITIKANKATPDSEPVKLTMKYGRSNSEEFTLIVKNPEGQLYIQDDLVDNGVLIPQGIDTEGVTYEWSRSDEQSVNAAAISEDGKLNVSIDRGGMTPSRTSPITYTVTAKNSGGDVLGTAKYTVNYSTQIMNNSFESPTVTNVDGYQSYPNNYAGLYWKTTAPGSDTARSMDVELMVNGNTSYLANEAQMIVADGNQAAELNAEAVGTLYQDLLTTPGSTLTWSVSHAARTSETSNNTMYIIVAATKVAQDITTASDVKELLDSIPEEDRDYINNPEMVSVGFQHEYNGVTFYIWKHTATKDASAQDQWHKLSGSVRIPEGQYLTRFFFASDPYATTDATKGNLIDGVAAAEMLRYKIQYHIDGVLDETKNQAGTAAVTTTVSVRDLKDYLENGYEFDTDKDGGYIQINGNNHVNDYKPTNKSLGLYITGYRGSSGDANTPIVMDIYLKTSETSLTITKSGWNTLDPDQTYLFNVAGTNIKGEEFELTVTIVGNGSATITGLKVGTECTVKEITEWSWRYTPDDSEQAATLKVDPAQNKMTFENSRPNIYWLDGNAYKDNVFATIPKDDE